MSFNPIIEAKVLLTSFKNRDSKARQLANMYCVYGCNVPGHDLIKLAGLDELIGAGSVSAHLAGYLWLAVETRHNIIVYGERRSVNALLLNAMTAFVPRSDTVLTAEQDPHELKSTGMLNVTALYGRGRKISSAKDCIANSAALGAERIMLDQIRGNEAEELFAMANKGVSFMAGLEGTRHGSEIIAMLTSRPMHVSPRRLSAIDIAISVKEDGESSCSLSSISEYRWLSRAEIECGTEIAGQDMVQVCDMAEGPKLNPETIAASKVISAYSRMQGIREVEAIAELERRAKLIEERKGSAEDAVRRYPGW